RPVPVTLLPLDDQTTRALDETLADWRHEAADAPTMLQRAVVGVHGVLGVMTVLLRTGGNDLARLPTWRAVTSTLALAALFSLIAVTGWAPLWAASGQSTASALALLLPLLPMAIATCLPIALLARPFGVIDEGRRAGALGACAVLTIVAALNVGWLSPVSNQVYREAAYELQFPDAPLPPGPTTWPRPGPAELMAGELVD